jgi:hypothetical protein
MRRDVLMSHNPPIQVPQCEEGDAGACCNLESTPDIVH